MKTLELICDCGARQRFHGASSTEIIAAIDAAGWQDYPDDSRPLPRGQQHANCPTCLKNPECDAE